ncbi:cation diffusion facilitator CzcD-associated flavoprotein CzcO [Okibacterium sp. HSC-33S16]|nr:cation diffusion facilitator CzcD-associated flavoprotein CzcO [Okibacterium sp. HSC-33S16]
MPPADSLPTVSPEVDVVVIGAGQAGLSAAYHLQRRGFVPVTSKSERTDDRSYVVLDAERGPGGAWRHRWKSLVMATVNGISDLPGIEKPDVDPSMPSSEFLTRYFDDYERELGLAIVRPVRVSGVFREDDNPNGQLRVESDAGTWRTRAVINATGTWTRPFWPLYPGQSSFRGRQLHVADYVAASEFAGQHVAVIGGGISAVQLRAGRRAPLGHRLPPSDRPPRATPPACAGWRYRDRRHGGAPGIPRAPRRVRPVVVDDRREPGGPFRCGRCHPNARSIRW